MDPWYVFKKANLLFTKAYALYKPLYFFYKRFSDRKHIKYIRSVIKPGMCVLDIGANIGFYSLIFSKITGPKGMVYAFEPDKTNYLRLADNTKHKNNVTCINKAVSNFTGVVNLYISNELNVDHHTYNDGEERESIEVSCVSTDDFMKDKTLPSFIKIDIQGYDYFAVQGMTEIISKSTDLVIFGEFSPYGLKKSGASPQEYYNFLVNNGLAVTFLDKTKDLNQIFEKESDKFYYTDFIATKMVNNTWETTNKQS